jgi:hypothetical protein
LVIADHASGLTRVVLELFVRVDGREPPLRRRSRARSAQEYMIEALRLERQTENIGLKKGDVERSFAHVLDRGGMRRAWLRGRENLHKRT